MPNSTVQLINDYIFVELDNDLNLEAAKNVTQQVIQLGQQLRSSGKKIRILCNISGSTNVDRDTRNYIAEVMKGLTYDKIGAYGQKSLMRNIANLTLLASGVFEKARIFNSKEEALLWINSE
jgi:hypothetical protein